MSASGDSSTQQFELELERGRGRDRGRASGRVGARARGRPARKAAREPRTALDVKTSRVPGAAAIGRDRITALRGVAPQPAEDGALCVAADAPLPLSAGG